MFSSKKNISLNTSRLSLRLVDISLTRDIVEYIKLNKDFHKHAMPERMDFYYTTEGQRTIISQEHKNSKDGKSHRLYAFDDQNNLVADILIGDVKTGKVASCSIGIKVSKDQLRKGYATEILNEIIRFCFFGLNVYRIEANILENNFASISLFEKLGFVKEGISRAYLFTNGDWQDHLRYSLLKPEFKV